MSPAPTVSTMSPARTAWANASASVIALATPGQRSASGHESIRDQARAHAINRAFARRIDLREKNRVRLRERHAKFAGEIARASKQMRLERRDETAVRIGDPCGGQRGRHLARVVRVVVHHDHIAHFAECAGSDARLPRTTRDPSPCLAPSPRAPARSTEQRAR